MKIRYAGIILLTVLLASCHTSKENRAEVKIFTGGTILTVDKDFSEAEAVAVKGNRIISVGRLRDVRRAVDGNYELIDLEGKTMLPGFVDPHNHVINGAMVNTISEYVGMADFRTTEEVLAHLNEYEKTLAPGEWLVASSWDPSIMEGPEALTFKELDQISTERAVFVLNASGHLAYANSKAFESAGIDNSVIDPPGAEFVRDEDGELNGVMKNNLAFMQVLAANPALADIDLELAIVELMQKFASMGITTSTEQLLGSVTGGRGDFDLLLKAAENPGFTGRVRAYPGYTVEESLQENPIMVNEGNDLVRAVGYKLVADGSNQGFTGFQREVYMGTCNHGHEYLTVRELIKYIVEKTEEGWQLSIHGNGDRAIDNILEAFERAKGYGADFSELRPRIEHTSILHDGQIQKMKELGISASFLIGHVHYWGVDFRDNIFGEEKAWLLDRAKSVEDAGISYTLHSDYPVTFADPMQMIYTAVTRETWKEPDYVLNPAERVSVESAIRALTIEAAWQTMSDHEIGSLEEGKFADLVILDRDPRKVDPREIPSIDIVETWVDGRQVYSRD
ncbi:MAG: amidohydrolase family protein [Spirochaetales bacterium]|nr:amidohydrolase family protein [Spirochaetales bacterium]